MAPCPSCHRLSGLTGLDGGLCLRCVTGWTDDDDVPAGTLAADMLLLQRRLRELRRALLDAAKPLFMLMLDRWNTSRRTR